MRPNLEVNLSSDGQGDSDDYSQPNYRKTNSLLAKLTRSELLPFSFPVVLGRSLANKIFNL